MQPTPDSRPPAEPLDALVVESATDEWTKVAVFIARVVDAARARGLDCTGQAVAARLYVLVDENRIAAQGNVRRWRAGAVRKVVPAPLADTPATN